MQTKSKRRYSQQAQELVRFKVADYLGKNLGTQKQCAEVFGLSEMGCQ